MKLGRQRTGQPLQLIHRRDEWRAQKLLQERALNNPKIVPVWNTVVEEIGGEDKVQRHNQRSHDWSAQTPAPYSFRSADWPGVDSFAVKKAIQFLGQRFCGRITARRFFLQALEANRI